MRTGAEGGLPSDREGLHDLRRSQKTARARATMKRRKARIYKKNPAISTIAGFLVREAGLEPARPEWTLEPESSESANSTTRASCAVSRLLRYIIT